MLRRQNCFRSNGLFQCNVFINATSMVRTQPLFPNLCVAWLNLPPTPLPIQLWLTIHYRRQSITFWVKIIKQQPVKEVSKLTESLSIIYISILIQVCIRHKSPDINSSNIHQYIQTYHYHFQFWYVNKFVATNTRLIII